MSEKKSKNFCLIGEKIDFSLSPAIHNFIFERDGVDAIYDIFKDLEKAYFGQGFFDAIVNVFDGFNVTTPFKSETSKLIENQSERAKITESINTVMKDKDGKPYGDNTDIEGINKGFWNVISDLYPPKRKLVLLGGGGVAGSMIYSFIEQCREVGYDFEPQISVFMRHPSKGMFLSELAENIFYHFQLNGSKPVLRVFRWNDKPIAREISEDSVIVNATPRGSLQSDEKIAFDFHNVRNFPQNVAAFDMVYNPSETEFLRSASESGIVSIGGLGMLVYQAIESLKIWLDREVSTNGIFEFLESIGHQWFRENI